MLVTPQEAARYLITINDGAASFMGFEKAIHPERIYPGFQIDLIDTLDALEKGELSNSNNDTVRRVLITMPPRYGKTNYATTDFPVYYLAKKPAREVMSTSYNSDLAKTFGRACRDLAREPVVSQVFPHFQMSDESTAVDDWRTSLRGGYFATGMQGGTPGRAANLLLTDDPIKARLEADSATYRNKAWSYYISALRIRKQPEPDGSPPIEIMIMTRWHPDDPAGRIMETEEWKAGLWHHINYQGITERDLDEEISASALPPSDARYIPPGQLSKVAPSKRTVHKTEKVALWPERGEGFRLEDLEILQRLNPREFESLYQQNPYIQGGNIIKSNWWQTYDTKAQHAYSTIIIGADTAFKKTETSDYSVLMVAGLTSAGDIHILDVIRDRYEFPELKRRCITLNNLWRGKGLRGLYIEDKASGQSLIQELKKESGVSVLPYKVGTDKIARINAVTPLIEGGRVFLPADALWLDAFIAETEQFPSSAHDDQCDALSLVLDVLSRTSVTGSAFNGMAVDMRSSLASMAAQPTGPGAPKVDRFAWGE